MNQPTANTTRRHRTRNAYRPDPSDDRRHTDPAVHEAGLSAAKEAFVRIDPYTQFHPHYAWRRDRPISAVHRAGRQLWLARSAARHAYITTPRRLENA